MAIVQQCLGVHAAAQQNLDCRRPQQIAIFTSVISNVFFKKTKFEEKNFIAGETSPPRPVNGKCLSLALPRSILTLDG